MTTTWTKVVPHGQAARRAGGRSRINAQRHRAAEKRRDQVVRMVMAYGLEHGVRQRIADELGVHRSTVSRDIRAALYLPPETLPQTPYTPPTEWIRILEPLGARLAAEDCDCEDRTEPRHRLVHVLMFTCETLDAYERGEVELPEDGRQVFEEVRDVLIGLLY
jgi:hypothetical protein